LQARSPKLPVALLLTSGAVGLAYEMVWLRRLGLVLGGSAVAASVTVAAFMGGLGLGAALAGRRAVQRPWRTYALLEASAAGWAIAFPLGYGLLQTLAVVQPSLRWPVAAALVGLPAIALGATWPVLAARVPAPVAGRWYAANTAGAVLGVLGSTFVMLPLLGVRGTELAAACLGLAAAGVAWTQATSSTSPRMAPVAPVTAPWPLLAIAAATGMAALGLELVWMRLAAVAFGATVQTLGGVLAAFLGATALGAALGTRTPTASLHRDLGLALSATGVLALAGALSWSGLPYGLMLAWQAVGARGMLPASLALATLAMAGAPIASGAAFTLAIRHLGASAGAAAGRLYAANTLGSIAGALLGGLVAIPALEMAGATAAFAGLAVTAGALWLLHAGHRRWAFAAPAVAIGLALVQPRWDAKLYAVGVHLRISDFADPTLKAVRTFADEGWELLYYDQGATGAVAVGRSTRTGNVWLSVNGKVDASTGGDMPTQQMSGAIPVAIARNPNDVVVVGLASGVTVGTALEERRVTSMTVLELEPSVVPASHFFDHVNGRPLDDPRTALVIDDARAWLARQDRTFDVIISEPSNPWITGVSNLFTLEYWALGRQRLSDGGVFAQWVQLYGMGPDEVRGLLRTFQHVFGDVWVFETIEGTDLLLVGGRGLDRLPENLPLRPRLDPEAVRCLAGTGWLNTDDRPIVEWRAPAFLHYSTAEANERLLATTCP